MRGRGVGQRAANSRSARRYSSQRARSAAVRSLLARLGDVALLRPRARARSAAMFCSRPGWRRPRRSPATMNERRAVDALDGLLHALRGQHAAVVVLEDQLASCAPSCRWSGWPGTPTTTSASASGACASSSFARRVTARAPRRGRSRRRRTLRPRAPCATSTERPSSCRHQRWCERPRTMWPTPCERAKSSSAAAGSSPLRRTTSAPSSRAFSMLASRWRCASASMRCGASLRRLDVDHEPVGVEPARQARAAAQQRRRARRERRHADHHPPELGALVCAASGALARAGRARAARAAGAGAVQALGHLAQRQLAQGGQVVVHEEVLQRPGDLVGGVDLAALQPLQQILDRQVEVHDLIGLLRKLSGRSRAP